jgi:hypothetical protein
MRIDRNEVLRYLGYKNQEISSDLNCLIDICIDEIKDISKPHYTYRLFDIDVIENEIRLKGCNLVLRGKDIYEHLKYSKKCALLAATIGIFVDNKIRYLTKTDITKSLILDSCGTEVVECLCNMVEEQINNIAQKEGLTINYRFSPGYGDLSLDIQPQILAALNALSKIGLTCTENYILLPRKSVTAIIGFVEDNGKKVEKGCTRCSSYHDCLYRREGVNCGL